MLVLDCDMVPHAELLVSALPHFYKVGAQGEWVLKPKVRHPRPNEGPWL